MRKNPFNKIICKILGKKLKIIQLNNDSGITLLTGQKSPQCELNKDQIDKVKQIFQKINEIEDLYEFYKGIIDLEKPNEWKPVQFQMLLKKIKEFPIDIKTAYFETLQELKNCLNEQLSFIKHLIDEKPIFLETLENGDCLLLDGMTQLNHNYM